MKKTFFSSIAGASILVISVSIIGRFFGFIREVLFANYFGLTDNFDLYLVGAAIPVAINSAVVYVAQNYFIPGYHREKFKGQENQFFNRTLSTFIIGSVIVTLLLIVFSQNIIEIFVGGSLDSSRELLLHIFIIFCITIPLNAIISVLTSFQHVKYDFISPSVSFFLQNLLFILSLIFFQEAVGIYIIPLGFVVGVFVQFIYLSIISYKHIEMKYLFGLKNFKLLLNSTLLILILTEISGQIFILIDRLFYSSVDPGGIAALNYALNLYTVPIGIISFSLLSVIFPKISDLYSGNSIEEFKIKINQILGVHILFYIPITFVFIVYGDNLISLLYERGEFTHVDTLQTYSVFMIFSFSLTFYATYSILNKYFYSKGDVKTVLVLITLAIIIKTVLNILLVDSYSQEGLAISTTISFTFLFLASFYIFNKNYNNTFYREIIIYLSITLLNAIITIAIVKILAEAFFIHSMIAIILFMTLYIMNAYFLKDQIIKLIYTSIRRK